MSVSKTTISYLVQLGGIAAFTVGAILSAHHLPICSSFLGGSAAFYVGNNMRTMT